MRPDNGGSLLSVEALIVAMRVSALLISIVMALFALRPDEEIVGRPISEDGYYIFSVAKNVAHGRGVTIDGTTPTNGFQPFFTFLIVPLFLFSPDNLVTPIRYVYALHWLVFWGSALLLGKILVEAIRPTDKVERSLLFWVGVYTYTTSVLIFLDSFSGLETGLLLFGILAIIRYYQRARMSTPGDFIRLGVLLGILVLIRIDQVFLVIVFSFVYLFSDTNASVGTRCGRAAAISVFAFLVSSPWWFYNLFTFGSLMPSSGAAQQDWQFSTFRLSRGLTAILDNLMPLVYMGRTYEHLLGDIVRFVLVLGTVWLIVLDRVWFKQELLSDRLDIPILKRTVSFCGMLLASNFLLALWYVLSSYATYFYPRYLAGAAIASLLAISYVLWKLLLHRRVVGVTIMLAPGALIVAALVMIGQGKAMSYLDQLALINDHVPTTESVAAFQTGTIGYFRERVVNLDGKVNSEVLSRQSDIGGYLKSRNINWICDAVDVIPLILHADSLKNRTWEFVSARETWVLYHRSDSLQFAGSSSP